MKKFKNDPREWKDLKLNRRKSRFLDPYQQEVLQFVSDQKHIKKAYHCFWSGNKGKHKLVGLYHHTASVKTMRQFYFDYWKQHNPQILQDCFEQIIMYLHLYGSKKSSEWRPYFDRLQKKDLAELSFLEFDRNGYATRTGKNLHFRKTVRTHLDTLVEEEILQKPTQYNYFHAVSVHPRWLRK